MKLRRFLSLMLAILMICGTCANLRILARDNWETRIQIENEIPEWVKEEIEENKRELETPGIVKVFKPKITEDPKIANKWKVGMLVAARDPRKTTDIVLVMDTSGSMLQSYRLYNAKVAAMAFVDAVLDEGNNTRIGLVDFGSDVYKKSDFTDDKGVLKEKIDALVANGATFTQGGVFFAREMLKESTADMKYIVVLSDGYPTYSYKITGITDNNIKYFSNPRDGRYILPNVSEEKYNYGYSVGNGRDLHSPFNEAYKIYYDHGSSAIAEAGFAKRDKIRVYSVGLQTDQEGSRILREMASAKKDFVEVQRLEDLEPVFRNIASKINKAASNGDVQIDFNGGFELISKDPNSIKTSPGSKVEIKDKKPEWTMDSVNTVYDINDPALKYEYIEYEVTINNDILKEKNPENGMNPLKAINFNYQDEKGDETKKEFPNAQCKPKLYILEKEVKNNEGGAAVDNAQREFQFKVEKKNGFNHYLEHEVISLRPGERKILTRPVKGANYRIYELNKGKAYNEKGDDYKEFNVNDYYNQFSVSVVGNSNMQTNAPRGGVGKSAEIFIANNVNRCTTTFKNTEVSDPKAIVTLTKTLEKEIKERAAYSAADIETKPQVKKFIITLTNQDNPNANRVGDKVDFTLEKGKPVTKDKMRFCTYQLHEDEETAKPYKPKGGEQDKKVKVTLYDVLKGSQKGQSITFTNVYNPDQTTTFEGIKKWEGGLKTDRKLPKFSLYKQTCKNKVTVTFKAGDGGEFTTLNNKNIDKTAKNIVFTIDKGTSLKDNNIHAPTVDPYTSWRFYGWNKRLNRDKKINEDEVYIANYGSGSSATDRDSDVTIYVNKPPKCDLSEKILVSGVNPEFEEQKDGNYKIVWKNLPKYDDNGKEYVYSFEETGITHKLLTIKNGIYYVPKIVDSSFYDRKVVKLGEGNDKNIYVVEQDGNTITNKYVIPKTDEIIATKKWDDNKNEHPSVEFELWRKNGTAGDGERVVDKTTLTNDEVNFDEQDKTDINGVEFEYYVKEPNVPENYTASIEGLKVTNTYVAPKDGTFTATKVWNGNEKVTRPEIKFTLHRKVGETDEVVPQAEVKTITKDNLTATWDNLETTNAAGEKYEFYVTEEFKEEAVTNQNWVLGEFEKEGNKITNKVITDPENPDNPNPKTEKAAKLTIKKVFENEPAQARVASTMSVAEPIKFEFKVTGPYGYETTFTLAAGEEKVLDKLYYGEYKVEETNSQGYTPNYSEKDGKVTLTNTDTTKEITVTNKNIIGPKNPNALTKTVEKVWVNGPKPSTTIELWRKNNVEGEKAIDEKVGEFTANDKTTSKEFTNLAKHDANGYEYEYYVKEPNVPENYTASIEGLKVTNTYKIPKITFTANKVWIGDEKVTRPEVRFILYRTLNGEQEKVANVEEKVIGSDLKAEWKDLPKTDNDGNEYNYFVKEEYVTDDIRNFNFRTEFEGNTIKNIVKTGNPNNGDKLEKPSDDKLAKVLIKKAVDKKDIKNKDDEFTFSIVGPYNFTKEVKVKANSTVEVSNLYYGHYKVIETDSKGFKSSIGSGIEFDLKEENDEKIIDVVNSKDLKNLLVNKKVVKVWEGGPKESVNIELWRKSAHVDEKVGEYLATKENPEKEFKNLRAYDEWNEEYKYYVKEPNVPSNYISKIDNLTVTNTFVSPKSNHIIARKVWVDGDLAEFGIPEISFELWRKTSFGEPELVVPATIVPHDDYYNDVDTIDFGIQDELAPNGERYDYFVKEIFSNLDDEYDWEKRENGLVVENLYVGPLPESGIRKPVKIEEKKSEIHKAYVKGYPDFTVRPNGYITRAEAAAIVARLEGYGLFDHSTPNFPDTNVDWYKPYINAVVREGVMKGYPDKTFKPNQNITRAEFAQMLMPLDKINNSVAPFKDVKGHWAEKAINQAFGNNRIDGYPDGRFKPDANITRAEAVAMLNRKYNRVVDKKGLMDRYYKYICHFSDLKVNEWYYYDMIEATNTHEFRRRGTKDKYFREHEDWIKILKSNVK